MTKKAESAKLKICILLIAHVLCVNASLGDIEGGLMKEINISDFRKKFREILDDVRYGKEPYIIKKNGRQIVVLMDIDLYRASQDRFQEAAFIEEYSADRIREFMSEDKIKRGFYDRFFLRCSR